MELLRAGGIVAVKGLGGYHLACDAADEEAVARLRERKRREEKPFAVMAADAAALVELGTGEEALLRSRERPIVLARRRAGAPVAPSVAPGTPWLGVMLPYTPLHHLLLADHGGVLVMTSGNVSDEPIAVDDADAERRLGAIADAFLAHDRPIHRRCEDSVVRVAFPLRRSRGLVPAPLPLPVPAPRPLVAAGPELKATFCVARGAEAFLSPHLGDLDGELAYRAFRSDLDLYLAMLDVRPEAIAHDLHPEYLSTKWALSRRRSSSACSTTTRTPPPASRSTARPAPRSRSSSTAPATAPTGRSGAASCCAATSRSSSASPTSSRCRCPAARQRSGSPGGARPSTSSWPAGPCRGERWALVRESLKVNAPLSSGMGRLFDAVAALLGVRDEVSYEGQAAIELELLAGETAADPYDWRFGSGAELVALVHDDLAAGRDRAEIAAAFHETVAAAAAAACAAAAEPRTVVLSGGTLPEPAPARLDAQRGSRTPASGSSRTGSCRRTTAASRTARPPSPPLGLRHSARSGQEPASSSRRTPDGLPGAGRLVRPRRTSIRAQRRAAPSTKRELITSQFTPIARVIAASALIVTVLAGAISISI